ncbi:MAG: NAD(P)H-hydrate dehydratase [Candidatus Omnitrophica bacterium]|nr:NAD(P)H-hydrate dehydratase [Candidatus Omnitrophota bacterium]
MRLPTRLLRRPPDSHKGDFGHILIIAGSPRFPGAALLCARGALRSGAGLVTVAVPKGLIGFYARKSIPEIMFFPLPTAGGAGLAAGGLKQLQGFLRKIDVVAAGPGLGQHPSTQAFIRKLIAGVNSRHLILDADGLNALSSALGLLSARKGSAGFTVLTPHSGEMARLLGISIAQVEKDRLGLAKKLASAYNLTVVLKGRGTIVACGRAGKAYINKTGNPGMSTAGSGDVLAGMIASFLAQGLSGFEAARCAVHVHGLAGDLAAGEKTEPGMIASDIIEHIPGALKKCS